MSRSKPKKDFQFEKITEQLTEISKSIDLIIVNPKKDAHKVKWKRLELFLKTAALLILFSSWLTQNFFIENWKSQKYYYDLYGDASNSLTTKADLAEMGVRIFENYYRNNPDDSLTIVHYKTLLNQFSSDVFSDEILLYSTLNLNKKTLSDDSLKIYKRKYEDYQTELNDICKQPNTKENIDTLRLLFNFSKSLRGGSIQNENIEKIRDNRVFVMEQESRLGKCFLILYLLGSILLAISYVIKYLKIETEWISTE